MVDVILKAENVRLHLLQTHFPHCRVQRWSNPPDCRVMPHTHYLKPEGQPVLEPAKGLSSKSWGKSPRYPRKIVGSPEPPPCRGSCKSGGPPPPARESVRSNPSLPHLMKVCYHRCPVTAQFRWYIPKVFERRHCLQRSPIGLKIHHHAQPRLFPPKLLQPPL